MPDIGPVELLLILGIALLVIGPGKLPEVGAALGKTIREFRKASSDLPDSVSLKPLPSAPRSAPEGDVDPARTPVPSDPENAKS